MGILANFNLVLGYHYCFYTFGFSDCFGKNLHSENKEVTRKGAALFNSPSQHKKSVDQPLFKTQLSILLSHMLIYLTKDEPKPNIPSAF